MTEKSNKGKNNLPDFDSLNDRVINRASSSPSIMIKTNLDPKNVTEENPYLNMSQNHKESQQFKEFFNGIEEEE